MGGFQGLFFISRSDEKCASRALALDASTSVHIQHPGHTSTHKAVIVVMATEPIF